MKSLVILGLIVVFSSFSLAARAGDYYNEYDKNPITKLAAGIGDVATSWVEIPLSVIHYSDKFDPIAGVFLGIPVGAFLTAKDCVKGILNAAFFFAPPYDTGEDDFLHLIKELDEEIKENLW